MNEIHQEGYSLPVKQTLIDLLFKEMGNPPSHKTRIAAVSLLFKDLTTVLNVEVTTLSKYGLFHAMVNGILITSLTSVIWGRYTPNWKRKLI
nr:hypothetical protein [Pectobacterium versatile]